MPSALNERLAFKSSGSGYRWRKRRFSLWSEDYNFSICFLTFSYILCNTPQHRPETLHATSITGGRRTWMTTWTGRSPSRRTWMSSSGRSSCNALYYYWCQVGELRCARARMKDWTGENCYFLQGVLCPVSLSMRASVADHDICVLSTIE